MYLLNPDSMALASIFCGKLDMMQCQDEGELKLFWTWYLKKNCLALWLKISAFIFKNIRTAFTEVAPELYRPAYTNFDPATLLSHELELDL